MTRPTYWLVMVVVILSMSRAQDTPSVNTAKAVLNYVEFFARKTPVLHGDCEGALRRALDAVKNVAFRNQAVVSCHNSDVEGYCFMTRLQHMDAMFMFTVAMENVEDQCELEQSPYYKQQFKS